MAAVGDVTFVRRPEDLLEHRADTFIVDVGRPGVLDAVRSIEGARIIGFASHVDRDLMDAARDAGCTEVLARSAFFNTWLSSQ